MSRCIVVMQDPLVVGKKFRSFPSNFLMQPFQYFQIVNLVDSFSSWYKFIMNNPSNIKKSQQHCFDSWFGLTEFFCPGELAVFHCALCCFVSEFSFHLAIHAGQHSQHSDLDMGCSISKRCISSPKHPHTLHRPHILLFNWYHRFYSWKWAGHESNHSPPTTVRLIIGRDIPPLPL